MGGHPKAQEQRRRTRDNYVLSIILSAMAWFSLTMVFHLDEVFTNSQSTSSNAVLSPRSPVLCDSFLSNIPSYRFYPKRFFEQGDGRPFLSVYNLNHHNFTDILNARFLVFEPTSSDGTKCTLLYYHIHKNGGTTLERHVPLPVDNYYSKREKELGHGRFEMECQTIMDRVWKEQQRSMQPLAVQHSVRTFSFLRDPVPRFLSSVAQILKLRVWHQRLYPCYERNTTEELLDCVLDKLETGVFPEMHLAPQSFELYKQVMGNDIYIELVDLSMIGDVMQQLGAGKVTKERSTTGALIRRFPKFLLTMEALDQKRIDRICTIYAADVKLLSTTKVTQTTCLDAKTAGG